MNSNSPLVLGFALPEEQEAAARVVCFRCKWRFRKVGKEQYGETVSALTGNTRLSGNPYDGEEFPEGMLLFSRMTENDINLFLSMCRRGKLKHPALLAMQTETNSTWTPAELFAQLTAERKAIRENQGPVHSQEEGTEK